MNNLDKLVELIQSNNEKLLIELCKGQGIDVIDVFNKWWDEGDKETNHHSKFAHTIILCTTNYKVSRFNSVFMRRESLPWMYNGKDMTSMSCKTKEILFTEIVSLYEE